MFEPLLRSPTLCEVGWNHDGEQISAEALPVPIDITSVAIVVGDVLARHGCIDVLLNKCQVHGPARGSCALMSSRAPSTSTFWIRSALLLRRECTEVFFLFGRY